MKEREITVHSRDILAILKSAGIDEPFLSKLTKSRAINPVRGISEGIPVLWTPEDIFKVFACKIMLDEYRKKFSNNNAKAGSDLRYVQKFLPGLKFGGYKRFTGMKEWQRVSEEAEKHGIYFGKTQYAFVSKSG